MNDPIDSVRDNRFLKSLEVKNICENIRTGLEDLLLGLDDVGENHIVFPIFTSQQLCTRCTQLSQTTFEKIDKMRKIKKMILPT